MNTPIDADGWVNYIAVTAILPTGQVVKGCSWRSRSAALVLPDGLVHTNVRWDGDVCVVLS